MLLSQTSKTALRAVLFLATRGEGEVTLGRDIAEKEDIPLPTLAKILHALGHHGIVQATRGRNGGYALLRAPGDIRVGEIVEAVDGPRRVSRSCILGLDTCTDDQSCALHDTWKRFRTELETRLWTLTLEDANRTLTAKRTAQAALAAKS